MGGGGGLPGMGGGGDSGGGNATQASGIMSDYAKQAGAAEQNYLNQALGLTTNQFNLGVNDLNNYYPQGQSPLAPYSFGGLNAFDQLQQSAGMATLPGGSFQLKQALDLQNQLNQAQQQQQNKQQLYTELARTVDQTNTDAYNHQHGTNYTLDNHPWASRPTDYSQAQSQQLLDMAKADATTIWPANGDNKDFWNGLISQVSDLSKYQSLLSPDIDTSKINLTPEQQSLVSKYNDGTLGQSATYDPKAALGSFYNSPLAMALFGQQDPNKTPQENFKTSPDYQFTREQGLLDLEKRASSQGLLESGSLLKSMDDYNSGLASQQWNNYANQISSTFGNYQNQLSNISGVGANANQALSSAAFNQGASLAGYRQNYANNASNIYGALGTSAANSLLAQGNALGSGLINQYNLGQAQQGQQTSALGGFAGLFGQGGMGGGMMQNGGQSSSGSSGFNGGGALKGAASGAATGSSIYPGWGTLIGGVLGGVMGGFS